MDLSVVIPTRERWGQLAQTLDALERQELAGFRVEIVVVDNGSRDDSRDKLESRADGAVLPMRVAEEPLRGPAAARNTGVAIARSPLILFLGDDTPPASPDLLAGHIRAHRCEEDVWRGILGRSTWHPRLDVTAVMEWNERSGTFFNYSRLETHPAHAGSFYTNNISLRREAFEAVGGFDERFPDAAGEDVELGVRLFDRGFRLDYHPELLVFHDHWYDFETSLRRMEVAGRSIHLLRRLHPGRPDIDAPHPSGPKAAIGRVLGPVVGAVPVPAWLPGRLRDRVFRVTHRAAMVRGYVSKPPIPADPPLRGR